MKSVLVIGLGEVGMSLYEIIDESEQYKVFGLDPAVPMKDSPPSRIDIIHICFFCKDVKIFVDNVCEYEQRFRPHLIIINSTVPPKTTNLIAKRCSCLIAHSPIFGTHKSKKFFKYEIRRFAKVIGGVTINARDATIKHFCTIGLKTLAMRGPLESETLKIMETTYYGAIIAFAQEFHRIAKTVGADYEDIMKVICYLHELSFARPPAYPDVIGGHCIIPNIDLLLSVCNSDFLVMIKESNTKRQKEIESPEIAKEIAKIRKVVSLFWKRLKP